MLTPDETAFVLGIANQALVDDPSRRRRDAWQPRLSDPAALAVDLGDVLDDLFEWYVDDACPVHHGPSTAEIRERLERLVIRLLLDAPDQSTRICIGCSVWYLIFIAANQGQRAPQFAWRIVRTVTRAAHGREDLLQDLAVCWFEELCNKPDYLPALLDGSLPLSSLIDIATHTGYMSREEQAALHRALQAALPREEIWSFRQAVTAKGYAPWT